MKNDLGIGDLKEQLTDIQRRYPALRPDDLFVAWFLRAYLTEDEKAAVDAVTGGSGDRSVDAVLVDHKARGVFLVQGKYRQALNAKGEKRSDVMAFAGLAEPVTDPDPARFVTLTNKMHPHAAVLLRAARPFVTKDGYRLWLYYVTMGSVSEALADEAQETVQHACQDSSLEILDGKRLMHLLRDYLDGVAPPIPTLDLEMEQHAGVKVNGVLQRFDSSRQIESWVFSMRGDAVARIVDLGKVRLYARNIRGFLGSGTSVNEGMAKTLQDEPDHFFYYNNGITIICDRAEKRSHSGSDFLRVSNPQVINGQQTSRMLASDPERAASASVLVKVMRVPREPGVGGGDGFDALISRIVANTNWQNSINYADLRSNDRVQIEIERGLRKVGYFYLRKRQKQSEARASAGKAFTIIKKEEMAQASAACSDMDPVIVRQGKDHLFGEHYDEVFPKADADFYLPKWWLRKYVSFGSKGYPQRAYAKWLVLNSLWQSLRKSVGDDRTSRQFRALCEQEDHGLSRALDAAVELTFKAALDFYDKNKGKGPTTIDHSAFFRKAGLHIEFADFWSRSSRRRDFEKHWARVSDAFK